MITLTVELSEVQPAQDPATTEGQSSISSDQTQTPAFKQPGSAQRAAYNLGVKLRGESGGNGVSFNDLPDEVLHRITGFGPITFAFFESGVRGAKMPVWATGRRRGPVPTGGVSRNHVEGREEIGVSMSSVDGVDYEWAPMGGRASQNTAQYEGWLLDPDEFWGSDGEPLMVGLMPLEDGSYIEHPITQEELKSAIARRPSIYSRFEKYLPQLKSE